MEFSEGRPAEDGIWNAVYRMGEDDVKLVLIHFSLERGQDRGAPCLFLPWWWSPWLRSPGIVDPRYGNLKEKVALYAYDLMLYLGDTEHSLSCTMITINTFRCYSGLSLGKSALLLMDPLSGHLPADASALKIWVSDCTPLNILAFLGKCMQGQHKVMCNVRPALAEMRPVYARAAVLPHHPAADWLFPTYS